MSGYNANSCNALEKPFYRPVEAALRWCGLIAHEGEILSAVGDCGIPKTGQFPQWPCLQSNTENIFNAIRIGSLPYGRDGVTVGRGETVARARLTILHSDLREWMAKHYPAQKPPFLFDEIERKTHAAINKDSFLALQADRDAARAELKKAEEWAAATLRELEETRKERDYLKALVDQAKAPRERSVTTYLNIIGGLLDVMLGTSPSGKKQSVYENQAAIISALLGRFEGKPGMSKRTLEDKFAEANRTLSGS